MNLETATPAEIDGVLFPILDKIACEHHHLGQYRRLLGEVESFDAYGRSRGFNDPGVQRSSFERAKAEHESNLAGLETEAAPLQAEFKRRGGWTRYLVVPGGHLHFRHCHTLTPGYTMVGQIAEASGLEQGDVVGKYGETACTHCFPDAPVAEKKTPAEEGFCAGSGEYVRTARRYAPCPTCGEHVSVTSRGKLRKHKAA